MQVLTDLGKLPHPDLVRPVVTWGVFDGVHLGHQKVIREVVSWAKTSVRSSVVITFDRHPAEVLRGVSVPMISTLQQRLGLISSLGVDAALVISFTLEFSRTTAEEFLREIIRGKLQASAVVLGHDSMFGKDRAGDYELLARLAPELGLEIRRAEVVSEEGRPLASSVIRNYLQKGKIEAANRLLGREFAASGKVKKGDERGKSLGFPTANLSLEPNEVHPARGVYAARALLDGAEYKAVVNVGVRPTFEGGDREWVEAHLLDYPGPDFYGRFLELRFLSRLRPEKKFRTPEALKRQITKDIKAARRLLAA